MCVCVHACVYLSVLDETTFNCVCNLIFVVYTSAVWQPLRRRRPSGPYFSFSLSHWLLSSLHPQYKKKPPSLLLHVSWVWLCTRLFSCWLHITGNLELTKWAFRSWQNYIRASLAGVYKVLLKPLLILRCVKEQKGTSFECVIHRRGGQALATLFTLILNETLPTKCLN